MSLNPQKTWLPAKYMDESIPRSRPLPSSWIKRQENGTYILDPAFPDDDQDEYILTAGVTVSFQWTSSIFKMRFARGHEGPIFWPLVEGAETYAWQRGDADTQVSDPEELEQQINHEHEFHEAVEIEFYCWSEEELFIFLDGAFHPAVEVRP